MRWGLLAFILPVPATLGFVTAPAVRPEPVAPPDSTPDSASAGIIRTGRPAVGLKPLTLTGSQALPELFDRLEQAGEAQVADLARSLLKRDE